MVRTASFLRFLGDVYMKLQQKDMAKSAYLESYEKDPNVYSTRVLLHRLGICRISCLH